jgi:thermostable 8-oxoguanine DNA glycosylase
MAQTIVAGPPGNIQTLSLPDSAEKVMDGVLWGEHYALFTPAYWATMAWYDTFEEQPIHYRIGHTLTEEVAACILGGYGIPAEVGWAAFYRIRQEGLLEGPQPGPEPFIQLLGEPLTVNGHKIRYRFATQKARYLNAALTTLHTSPPPIDDDVALRNWLLNLAGVGPKTASWITRNWLQSDNVAIIDIHIHRAGLLMGLYNHADTPAKNYFEMERKFLDFARLIKVKASILDALIWYEMKHAGTMALDLVKKRRS